MSADRIVWDRVESQREWDAIVGEASDRNVFQSSAWGEYRRGAGWTPRRWAAHGPRGERIMLVQTLTRSAPGNVHVSWAPGGPLFGFAGVDASRIAAAHLALIKILEKEGRGFLRASSHAPHDARADYAFSQMLHRPYFPLNSGFTIRHDLTRSSDQIHAGMSEHHRYYVKRALESGLRLTSSRTASAALELVAIHDSMRSAKKHAPEPIVAGDVLAICKALSDSFLIYTAYVRDEPASAWLVSLYHDRAVPLRAATGSIGREVGASYGLIFQLLLHLKELGATEFDFGAINPQATQGGVNYFKWGFGGEVTKYLGEWEWSNSRVLRLAVNVAARRRSDVA